MISSTSLWKRKQAQPKPKRAERHEEINPKLSQWSSPAVPNGGWCSSNFLLGAGMVLIQRSTQRIVVVYEPSLDYWFFPRGRKDLSESLETAALREAYEESGYRAKFMPVYNPSRAPAPPGKEDLYTKPNTEPFYVTTLAWKETDPRFTQGPEANLGYQYLTSWYIGQIPDDAVPDRGTGVSEDEANYRSELLTYDEAMKLVWGIEKDVLRFAWAVFLQTLEVETASANESEADDRPEKPPESVV